MGRLGIVEVLLVLLCVFLPLAAGVLVYFLMQRRRPSGTGTDPERVEMPWDRTVMDTPTPRQVQDEVRMQAARDSVPTLPSQHGSPPPPAAVEATAAGEGTDGAGGTEGPGGSDAEGSGSGTEVPEDTQPPLNAPTVHAPSDDVEQTVRISRSAGRPVQDLSTPAAPPAAPGPPPPAATPAPAAESVLEPARVDEPATTAPTEPEHTYWDDEEAEQARRAESLASADPREIADGGYGWGSAAPFADGSAPPGHPVKANREWMQYHEPGSPWYDQAPVDVWFADTATAERAGFRRA